MLQKFYLWIDEKYQQKINEREARVFQEILQRFVQSYAEHKDKMELRAWLCMKLQEELPKYSMQDVEMMADEMIEALKQTETKKRELQEAKENGLGTQAWLAHQLEYYNQAHLKVKRENTNEEEDSQLLDSTKTGASSAATTENTEYLQDIDNVLDKANEDMADMITTKAGNINQNPNLDGFIAEQHHVDTFNINAKTNGSPYRARVLKSTEKDSVDIEIYDERTGKVVAKYQVKYGKTAEITKKLLDKGNYDKQGKVVPKEQAEKINSNGGDVNEVIEAPDGTKSEPLSKQDAKKAQNEAQSGNLDNVYDWNNVSLQDVTKGVAQNALKAGAMGVGIGVVSNVGAKLINGEKIETQEVVVESLKSGADFGLKTAAAGAMKVAAEKSSLAALKGISSSSWANVAFVAVENLKIAADIGRGKMSVEQGIEKMGESTASAVAGIAAAAKGTAIGASVGAVLGPVGSTVGGFVGGTLGYMAGSEVGKAVYEGVKVARKRVVESVKSAVKAVKNVANAVTSKAKKLFGFLGF